VAILAIKANYPNDSNVGSDVLRMTEVKVRFSLKAEVIEENNYVRFLGHSRR
jgi:hypothetical protein